MLTKTTVHSVPGGRDPCEMPTLLRLIVGEMEGDVEVTEPQRDHIHHPHRYVH